MAGGPHKASPARGASCFELSSLELGTRVIQNAYVPGDAGVGGQPGHKLNLNRASNSRPNEDFTGAAVGSLGAFWGGQIPRRSYACINYPADYPVFESNWAPSGNQTGLCAGIARPDVAGENVTLQPAASGPPRRGSATWHTRSPSAAACTPRG